MIKYVGIVLWLAALGIWSATKDMPLPPRWSVISLVACVILGFGCVTWGGRTWEDLGR